MANYSVTRSTHQTLGVATVDAVTVGDHVSQITVTNRQGSDEIYFTVDGTVPASGGDNTFVIPAVYGSRDVALVPPAGGTVVKLICASSQKYSVEGS